MRKILIAGLSLIVILVFSISMMSVILPPSERIWQNYIFEKNVYSNETDGLEEEKNLFNNFEFDSQDSFKINPKLPKVNVDKKYIYKSSYIKNCFPRKSGEEVFCSEEGEYNESFRVLNATENKIKYIGSMGHENEIVFSSEENFSNVFDDECYFMCKWFSYINENFSFGVRENKSYYAPYEPKYEKINNLEVFSEHILFSDGLENINGRNCLKVEVYEKSYPGTHSTCKMIPFIFRDCNITYQFEISKEIFWIDADERILVKMQRWKKDKLIEEVNLTEI